ncbi:MAG: oligosaccharide flippase family protein [Deltaproteobacteria bacterium]|nr:oligosaccharide flippase family protein [Deltaproteobacteria bacterium]
MKQSQRIAKNTLAGGLSISIGGILQLATAVLVARHVSVAEFGTYSFMIAFEFFAYRLSDCGISNILLRDLAVERNKISELSGAALSWAGFILILTFLITGSVISLLHIERPLALMTIAMALDGVGHFIAGCYGAVLLSQENNELYAVGFVAHKLVILCLVALAVILKIGLLGVIPAYIAGTLAQWCFYRWIVVKYYDRPHIRIDFRLWRYLIVNAVPVGAAGVVRLAAEQADIVILTWLLGTRAAGLFSGPYRISAGVRFLPMTVMVALYPLLARTAATDASHRAFQQAYETSVKAFVLIAFPIAAVLMACPHTLTAGLLGPDYFQAGRAMRLLGIGASLLIISQPFPFLLTALNRQRLLFVSSATALALRIGIDLALVPIFQFLAPCIALMISESVLILVWIGDLRRVGFSLPLGSIIWRPCTAAATIGALLYFASPGSLLSLAGAVMICGLAYFVMVFKMGAVSEVELAIAKEGIAFVSTFPSLWRRLAPGKI